MARGVNVKKLLGELSTVALVSTMARLVSGLSQPKGRRRLGWRCWINWMLLWETQSRGDSLAEEGGHTRHGGRGRCPGFFFSGTLYVSLTVLRFWLFVPTEFTALVRSARLARSANSEGIQT